MDCVWPVACRLTAFAVRADFHHYRPDLQAQGLINNVSPAPGVKPIWSLQYSASTAYNLTSPLTAAQWYQVGQRMFEDDVLFGYYYNQYGGGYDRGAYTPNLRNVMICNILGGSDTRYNYCIHNATAPAL
jgi:hypothetical protein